MLRHTLDGALGLVVSMTGCVVLARTLDMHRHLEAVFGPEIADRAWEGTIVHLVFAALAIVAGWRLFASFVNHQHDRR
jgi:hypothetical protein